LLAEFDKHKAIVHLAADFTSQGESVFDILFFTQEGAALASVVPKVGVAVGFRINFGDAFAP
jgi:hypothetical protein